MRQVTNLIRRRLGLRFDHKSRYRLSFLVTHVIDIKLYIIFTAPLRPPFPRRAYRFATRLLRDTSA